MDPPSEWLDHARSRDYYRLLTSQAPWEAKELLNPALAPRSYDPSITAFSLANALKISADDIPCIVVTEQFDLNKFVWFKTSAYHLKEQLIQLGYLAERTRPISHVRKDWEKLGLDLCAGFGAQELRSSLAVTLTSVLDFVMAGTAADPGSRRRALVRARETIAQLYARLNEIKKHHEDIDNEELDRLCASIVSFLAQLSDRASFDLEDFVAVRRELLEVDLFQILRTAQGVLQALETHQAHGLFPDESEKLDYTPGVICLAKVFEKEANLSVVHWARQRVGITLPEFFNRHQPGVRAVVVSDFPGGRKIDLNLKRQGKWLPPGIGQSELACMELSKEMLPDGLDTKDWTLLLQLWASIRHYRNRAAHTELMDRASFLIVRDALQTLSKNQIFDRLSLMKTQYRGDLLQTG